VHEQVAACTDWDFLKEEAGMADRINHSSQFRRNIRFIYLQLME
jgi:hypothetical protein